MAVQGLAPLGVPSDKPEVVQRKHFVIPGDRIPIDRVRKELGSIKGLRKVQEFDQHFSYFDDDKLTLYHQQVLLAEGRQLVLLKWRQELRSAIVSVCHRVHHEKWTGLKSRRKKVELEPKDVTLYLKGLYIPPKASAPGEVSHKAEVLHEVIESMGLQPAVHVVQKREIYSVQDASSRHPIIITVDHHVHAHRETQLWEDLVESDGQPYGAPTDIPLVFVKIRIPSEDEQPRPVPDILRRVLEEKLKAREANISKFQYACAALMPELCQVMPRWYHFVHDQFLQDSPLSTTRAPPTPRSQDRVCGLFSNMWAIGGVGGSDPTYTRLMGTSTDSLHSGGLRSFSNSSAPGSHGGHSSAAALFNALKPRVKRTKKDKGMDPKAFLCNERTAFQWLQFMILYCFFAAGLFDNGGEGTVPKILALTVICDVIMLYALIQFHRRRVYFVGTNTERGFLTEKRWNERFGVSIAAVGVAGILTAYLVYLVVTDGGM